MGAEPEQREFVIPDETSRYYWLMVVLDEALVPPKDDEFTVHSKQSLRGSMLPLREKGHDYLSIQNNQADVAESAEIRLFVPDGVNLKLQSGTKELIDALSIECNDDLNAELVDGEPISANADNNMSCPAGFKS